MAKKRRAVLPDVTISYRLTPFRRERYTLHEDSLDVWIHTPLETNEYTVDLSTLDASQSRYRTIPRKAVGTAVSLTVCAVVLAVLCAQGPALGLNAWMWVLPALALAGAAAAAVRARMGRRECVTFHRNDDGSPAIDLAWQLPDPETFDDFVGELEVRIEENRFDGDDSGLASELRGLDRLRGDGHISDQEFRAAKAMLLGLEPWQLEE